MNVRELIEVLQALPQDALVVVSGYEGGVEEVTSASVCMAIPNAHEEWYYGSMELDSDEGTVQVVFVG